MSDESESVPVRCGELIVDKYRVERPLGLGGMGAVVAARHLCLGELVAIKLMRQEFCKSAALRRRFQREARGMFRMKSEHVPRIFDVGTHLASLREKPGSKIAIPFIVMEYLPGDDLRSLCERRGRLPVDEAAEYVRQACSALAEAHALGVVHRDLKPANLFLTYRVDGTPLVKVLDFGVAKFTASELLDDDLEMTTAQTVMGSRRYMAPEQMLTPKDIDTRTDLWALGVVLYQLVSGKLPFMAETVEQLVLAVSEHQPTPLREVCDDVPEAFAKVVMSCLERDRERRPASAAELAQALAPFVRCSAIDATLPQATPMTDASPTWPEPRLLPAAPRTTTHRPASRFTLTHWRDRAALLGGAAVGVAAASVLLAIAFSVGRARLEMPRWSGALAAQPAALVAPGEEPASRAPADAPLAPQRSAATITGHASACDIVPPGLPGRTVAQITTARKQLPSTWASSTPEGTTVEAAPPARGDARAPQVARASARPPLPMTVTAPQPTGASPTQGPAPVAGDSPW